MGILAHRTDAAPQVPILATEQNFAAIHGRFKINLLLSDGSGLCYYGQEANASLADMLAGKVAEVKMNAYQGYNDCLQVERDHRTRYDSAVVYRRKNGVWQPVSWYIRGQNFDLVPLRFEKHITRYEVVVKDNLLSLNRLEVVVS